MTEGMNGTEKHLYKLSNEVEGLKKGIILEKHLIYWGILTALSILLAILRPRLEIQIFVSIATICVILFDIWRSITSKPVRKKYITYVCVFTGEIVFFTLLFNLFNLSEENTWFIWVVLNTIFVTIFVLLFDVAKCIRKTNEDASNKLYLSVIFLIIMFLTVSIPMMVIVI